jgi:hypothetical protein
MIGAAEAETRNARGHGINCPLPNAASFTAIETAARTALGDPLARGQDARRDSAMRLFAEFALLSPRELFRKPMGADALAAAQHNEWSMCLFAVYLSGVTSTKTTKALARSTIETYVETAASTLSLAFGFRVLQQRVIFKPLLARTLAAMDSETGARRKRQGLRRRHLREAASGLGAMRDADDINRWAAACLANTILLRAGELQHLRHRDATFTSHSGRRCLLIQVKPLKKCGGVATKAARVPTLIPEIPGDQACAYAALKRLLRLDPAGRASLGEQKPAGEEPIFRLRTRPPAAARANAAPCWQAVRTAHMDAYARRVARAVSLPPADVGGHSFRIGGATDFIDGGGSHEQLRGRGRWASDIGHIYARDTIGLQLGSVDAIVRANTMSLEELVAGYTQPARR